VLLCEGPFRWIRYPTLLSLLLYSLGAAFAFRSWLGLALLVPLAVAVVHRSQALDQRFAERYRVVWPRRSYRSKRIIPFVY
jgi:protein-S-isoprenylcysteine O-methyltransferase Ste14